MLLRARFVNGTVYIRSIPYTVKDSIVDVPEELALGLVLGGNYAPKARYKNLTNKCKKILIIRGSGLGDVLMCHPIRKLIKKRYPGIEIHFATDKKYSSTLFGDDTADRVFDHGYSLSFVRRGKYDYITNLNNVEFGNNLISNVHKIDLLARMAGVTNFVKDKQLFYKVKEEEVEWAKSQTGENTTNRWVAFVLESSCEVKHIKTMLAIKIIRGLVENGVKVFLFDKKRKLGKAICASVKSQDCVNCCGCYNVRECAAIISSCNLVFTPDTGFLHLGIALRKKVLAYFGAMGSHLVLTPGDVEVIRRKEVDCQPCNRFTCVNGRVDCLKFNPDHMIDRILASL